MYRKLGVRSRTELSRRLTDCQPCWRRRRCCCPLVARESGRWSLPHWSAATGASTASRLVSSSGPDARFVLIRGEAGIGKTALWRRARGAPCRRQDTGSS